MMKLSISVAARLLRAGALVRFSDGSAMQLGHHRYGVHYCKRMLHWHCVDGVYPYA